MQQYSTFLTGLIAAPHTPMNVDGTLNLDTRTALYIIDSYTLLVRDKRRRSKYYVWRCRSLRGVPSLMSKRPGEERQSVQGWKRLPPPHYGALSCRWGMLSESFGYRGWVALVPSELICKHSDGRSNATANQLVVFRRVSPRAPRRSIYFAVNQRTIDDRCRAI